MKKTVFCLATLAAVGGIVPAGCELVSEEYSKISSGLYPTTERDARDMVTAMYAGLGNNGYSGAFNAATGFHLLSDMATDQGVCGWGGSDWYPLVTGDFQNSAGARNPRQLWTSQHGNNLSRISKMELAIDRIKGIDMSAELKARYLAELECGQGFNAFLLWDWYGGIVLADLATLKKPQDEVILPRQTSDQTVAYIEGKLRSAIAVLPATIAYGSADYGRFTGGLCHTILLKLYMQTRQWAKAEAEGRELMKPEYGYALVTDKGGRESAYANIFSDANEGNSETVWAVNLAPDYQYNNWFWTVVDWGGFKMTDKFYDTFEAGDMRKGPNVIEEKSGAYLPLKYEVYQCPGGDCTTDWIIYRYADVLTLLAEAIVKKDNTVSSEAIGLLNQVRTRAGLAAYTAADLPDVNTFMDKLLWERAHELWYEGARRQDLIRNDMYVEVMKKKCADYGKPDFMTALGEANSHLFPLPSSAINVFRTGSF